MKAPILTVLLAIGVLSTSPADESPIVSPPISSDNSPAIIAAAKDRGAATAAKDIKAGTVRILYSSIPWPANKPLIDDVTGYRVQVVGGCVASSAFRAEINAYNARMREWHTKNNPAATSK